MEFKKALSDYTEYEFKQLITEIKEDVGTEKYQDDLVFYLNELIGPVGGSDLIFYPKPGADKSAEGIAKTVSDWCEASGLPGFKPRF
ncbi:MULTISPECIES: bacteriocin immunity protein [Pseudomonas]|uniref:Bacteriocin immunity protein n=1 Tax=Pseudomonas saxonica TaxID=2600598 RepID=A0ABY3GMA5_9PSED|nr:MULTISPECIES: bacteriocin immunity protein [Pseudomonas]MCH4873123.1 bacteriocin immunity protein [Pseudomonas sp. TMW22091]TWR92211.1 bacteriocin immunity protein [Pseudomonas saxonica]